MEPIPDPFELANEIFSEALELAPADRQDFVERRCASDPRLCESVLRLLSRFDKLGDFLDRPALEPARQLSAGMLLAGRFRILELIGRGGMGEVYRAEDTALAEPAALKVIRSESRLDPGWLARFRDEIRLARRIADPHVCKVFDVFTTTVDDSPLTFFSMEYLDGECLSSVLSRSGRLPAQDVLQIAEGIAAGLDAAHRQDVIHRDLKPANVMLVSDRQGRQRPVIMDFGLAKPAEGRTGSMTQSGMLVGTPDYMAPEQFLEEPLTVATDIFAFGILIYEMASGSRPYPNESVIRAAVRRVSEPPSLAALPPEVSAHWEPVLRRALARDPRRRYPSAGELARDLRDGTGRWRHTLHPSRRALLVSGGAAAISMSSYVAWRRLSQWGRMEAPILMLLPIQTPDASRDAAVVQTARAFDVQIEKGIQQSAYLRTMTRQEMAQGWKLMSPDTAMPAELSARQAREVALRKGASLVLRGELYRLGSAKWELKLYLELLGNSAEYPRDTPAKTLTAESDRDLLTAAAKAVDWTRETAGERRVELASRSRVPEEITTRDWQALREYSAAEQAWQARPESGEWKSDQRAAAEDHLRNAIAADSEFALAYARLADIQMASRESDEALRNYEVAARLIRRRNLTDREALRIAGLFALDTGQFADAERIFSRYSAAYPREGLPLFYQARAVECQGHVEAALRLLEEAERTSPDSYSIVLARAVRLLIVGRYGEAEKRCEAAARLHPGDFIDQLRCALAFARHDASGVWRSLERMKAGGSQEFRSKAYLFEACVRAEQGRWQDAEALLKAGQRFDREYLRPLEILAAKWRALARVYLAQGRRSEAAACCREILSGRPALRPKLLAAGILAMAGDIDGARSALPPELPRKPEDVLTGRMDQQATQRWKAWPIFWGHLLRVWGEIALAEERPRTAFDLLRNAPPPESAQIWPDTLVRASLASGERETAREHLARLLANPASYWIMADVSPCGFIRDAIARAPAAGLEPRGVAALNDFLQQIN